TAWGCAWLDLEERGVRIDGVVADGAEGLRAGARAAGLPEPRLDHWHTLRDLGRIARVLEHTAYRQMAAAERAERASVEATYRATHGRGARRGRPLGGATDPATVRAAVQAAEEAMARADGTAGVLATVRAVLRPVDAVSGQVGTRDAVASDLRMAAARLREWGGRATEAATLLEARVRPHGLSRRPRPRARRPPCRAPGGHRPLYCVGVAASAGVGTPGRRYGGGVAGRGGRRALGLGRARRGGARLGHGREPQQRPGRPPGCPSRLALAYPGRLARLSQPSGLPARQACRPQPTGSLRLACPALTRRLGLWPPQASNDR
ncbi:MAG: hypothetical protein LC769_09690, partial [Chloroflexi bacterium]|nr:hypothetical protein [Chloroflexota bacterium]